jgi:hypothetical protein
MATLLHSAAGVLRSRPSELSVTEHLAPDSGCQNLSVGQLALSLASGLTKGIHRNRHPVPEWVHQQVYLNPYPK